MITPPDSLLAKATLEPHDGQPTGVFALPRPSSRGVLDEPPPADFLGFLDGPNLYAYVRQNPWSSFDADGLFLSYLVEKFDEHVAAPFGDWVADSVSAETCVAVSESKACAAVEKTARVTFKASTTAFDVLCPGSSTCQATENLVASGGSVTDLGKAVVNDFGGKKLNMALSAGETAMSLADGDLKGAAMNSLGAIPGGKRTNPAAKKPLNPYEVGTADVLKGRSKGDGLDIHHAGQAHPMEQLVPGYDRATGPAIAIPRGEHVNIPTVKGPVSGTPRQQLAKDIRDLRNNTSAPTSSLRNLIDMNKAMYPNSFKK